MKNKMLVAIIAGAVSLFSAISTAVAAPIPGLNRNVDFQARDQAIVDFLRNFFSQVSVPVRISDGLTGKVNGRLNGTANNVLRDLAKSFDFVPYYDGRVAYIYPSAEVNSRLIGATPRELQRLEDAIAGLGIVDQLNTLKRTANDVLFASGTPRFLEQVEDMRRLEAGRPNVIPTLQPAQVGFRVFYLRHAWARDTTIQFGGRQVIVPGVASILQSITNGLGRSPDAAAEQAAASGFSRSQPYQERTVSPRQEKLNGQGLASIGNEGNTNNNNNTQDVANAIVKALRPAEQQPRSPAPGQFQQQQSNMATSPKIEADPRLNAVIVRDTVDRLPMYESLVSSLDVEQNMVEIQTTIIDVNLDRLQQLGVNWRWVNGRNEALLGTGSPSDSLLRAGATITDLARGAAVSTVLGAGANFISRIKALAADGAARVVSSPQVATLSNVEAVFDNNSTFYVRVAGNQQTDLYNVSTGTGLRVTPHVFREGDNVRIKLLVVVEDGALTGQTVDQIPIVERSTLNTQAVIGQGQSLLIGGMTRVQSTSATDKVPGLGDIPYVGNLFKTTNAKSARMERMVLIEPRLITAQNTAALPPSLIDPNLSPSYANPSPTPRAFSNSTTNLDSIRTAPSTVVLPQPAPLPVVPGLSPAGNTSWQTQPTQMQSPRSFTQAASKSSGDFDRVPIESGGSTYARRSAQPEAVRSEINRSVW